MKTDIANRFPENPILTPSEIRPSVPGMIVEGVFNPGAFRFGGKIWLLLRIAERPKQEPGKLTVPVYDETGMTKLLEFDHDDPKLNMNDPRVIAYNGSQYLTTVSHLRPVSSVDGIHFTEDACFPSLFGQGTMQSFGIEDARVTEIDGEYLITHSTSSPCGVCVGLRSTRDWRNSSSRGIIFTAHNKDVAIFDSKIGGKYFALHRPSSPEIGGNYIWLAESPDLEHWGHHRCIAMTRPGKWDSVRVGAGAAPFHTDKGWLEIYHGANEQNRYCLGAMLLDLNEPWKVLARSEYPIMEPIAECERNGFFGNVVFTNGHIIDGDRVTVYYGASDTVDRALFPT